MATDLGFGMIFSIKHGLDGTTIAKVVLSNGGYLIGANAAVPHLIW